MNGTRRILVIDENKSSAEALVSILSNSFANQGLTFTTPADLDSVMSETLGEKVVFAIVSGKVNGSMQEATRICHNLTQVNIRFIRLTGYVFADQSVNEEIDKFRGEGIFYKPAKSEEIIQAIRMAIPT